MARLSWNLLKVLEFLTKKIPNVDLNDEEIKSLLLYDKAFRI